MKVTLKKPVKNMEFGKWYELGDGSKRLAIDYREDECILVTELFNLAGSYTSLEKVNSFYQEPPFNGVFEAKEFDLNVGSIIHLKNGGKRLVVQLFSKKYLTVSPSNWEECLTFESLGEVFNNYKGLLVDIAKAEL